MIIFFVAYSLWYILPLVCLGNNRELRIEGQINVVNNQCSFWKTYIYEASKDLAYVIFDRNFDYMFSALSNL